ncbi:hypothetical protein [Chryseobacterium kwangjuense]|uniref:WG repeat-containing protein n=1 Tax=Chryseobacterium kwangjuense TaxID=267125 RepID=A0A135WL43_9FLAO|nr:hypothetical protein [Chryseobacterium kwangjuense]KXH85627.1 hypothetical protein AU378_07740 [Chryseobacterium kwangjuense]
MDDDQLDPEFKKAHNFIRTYLGKDRLHSDEEIQEQENPAGRFEYKFIPDMDFREYLESVSLEKHKNSNFQAAYPVTVTDNRYILQFKNRKHPFALLGEYVHLLHQVTFNINIVSQPFNHYFDKNYFHLSGVFDLKNESILILPYFYEIRYYKDFNVFCCSMFPDNEEDSQNHIKKLFYFDTKGRFIKEEKGYIPNRIPKIAYNEKEHIFTEINLEFVEEIHSHTMYTIEKEGGFGLVNHRNEFLIDGFYQKIFVSDILDAAITHNDNEIALHLFADKTKVKIAEGQLVDKKKSWIRFFDVHKKWGILNDYGIETGPFYNYLDWTYDTWRLKAFKGDFSWTYSDEFNENISPKITCEDEDMFTSAGKKLEKGKFGMINLQSEIIIPFEYEWIEELNPHSYLANKNGEVYQFDLYYEYSQWKRPEEYLDEYAVTGGEWYLLDLQGNIIRSVDLKEIQELYESVYEDPETFKENRGVSAYKF